MERTEGLVQRRRQPKPEDVNDVNDEEREEEEDMVSLTLASTIKLFQL